MGANGFEMEAISTANTKLDELAEAILNISREMGTGTLRVEDSEEERGKQICFVQGYVTDIDTGREDTALEAALLRSEAFSDKDIKRAKKNHDKK